MNDTTKKPWSKPGLIVLGRGKPEEAVLTNCKGSRQYGGDADAFLGCFVDACAACSFLVDS